MCSSQESIDVALAAPSLTVHIFELGVERFGGMNVGTGSRFQPFVNRPLSVKKVNRCLVRLLSVVRSWRRVKAKTEPRERFSDLVDDLKDSVPYCAGVIGPFFAKVLILSGVIPNAALATDGVMAANSPAGRRVAAQYSHCDDSRNLPKRREQTVYAIADDLCVDKGTGENVSCEFTRMKKAYDCSHVEQATIFPVKCETTGGYVLMELSAGMSKPKLVTLPCFDDDFPTQRRPEDAWWVDGYCCDSAADETDSRQLHFFREKDPDMTKVQQKEAAAPQVEEKFLRVGLLPLTDRLEFRRILKERSATSAMTFFRRVHTRESRAATRSGNTRNVSKPLENEHPWIAIAELAAATPCTWQSRSETLLALHGRTATDYRVRTEEELDAAHGVTVDNGFCNGETRYLPAAAKVSCVLIPSFILEFFRQPFEAITDSPPHPAPVLLRPYRLPSSA